jgi:gliding motility-associated-like protein
LIGLLGFWNFHLHVNNFHVLKILVYTTIFVFSIQFLHAQQPPICGNSPAMKSFCRDACIICDIDGFTGRNNSSAVGQAPPGFCTSQVHNMQWIGFIAGSSDLTLEVKVTNCTRNLGLEIGLYESLNCTTFRQVSECDTDVRPNTTRIFKNTVPLTIGQYYYFVMDGSSNDICDWTIKVISGSTKVAPLTQTPAIIVPDKVCQNDDFIFKTPGISGATFYTWTMDGVFINNEKEAKYKLSQPGKYQLCLEAANVCDKSPKICKTIEVLQTPATKVNQEICFGECFKYHGNEYCSSGMYEVRLKAINGCDSIITLDLKVADKIKASTALNICEGDTLKLGNDLLSTEGKHEVRIKNQEGCDIFMEINLKVIVCNIKASIEATPVTCNGENTGQVKFKVDRGTPPFTYRGFKIENPSKIFNGNIVAENVVETITNLDEGNYTFTIDDNYGNNRVIHVFVPQPSKLKVQNITSNYNNFQVSCFGKNDGFYKIVPSGAIPPYTFRHSHSALTIDSLSSLPSGTFMCTVTDFNGCSNDIEITIKQPDSMAAEIQNINPNCEGFFTGQINIKNVKGGVPPFIYALNNEVYSAKNEFQTLAEGSYTWFIKDANQCKLWNTSKLVAAEIPVITNKNPDKQVNLGDSTDLTVSLNLATYEALWSPSDGLSCPKCLQTKVLSLNTTAYEVEIRSKDGCISKSVIRVDVEKKRSFMISNAFSPNGDQTNDRLKLFAGNDVETIQSLAIYDRWGNLIYKTQNLPRGATEINWDGTIHHSVVSEGNYTWISEVQYIDGITKFHSGSLLILK